MDPTARYNRLREAEDKLAKIATELTELGLEDTVLPGLYTALNDLTIEVAWAREAIKVQKKESKP